MSCYWLFTTQSSSSTRWAQSRSSLLPSSCTGSGENLMLLAIYYSAFLVNKMGTVNIIIVALLKYGVRWESHASGYLLLGVPRQQDGHSQRHHCRPPHVWGQVKISCFWLFTTRRSLSTRWAPSTSLLSPSSSTGSGGNLMLLAICQQFISDLRST